MYFILLNIIKSLNIVFFLRMVILHIDPLDNIKTYFFLKYESFRAVLHTRIHVCCKIK